jgi:rubrerythrin
MSRVYSVDEVFAVAEQIERNGARFYARAAELAQDEELRGVLRQLAEWEAGHETTFGGMRARAALVDAAGTWDPEGEADAYLQAIAGDYVFKSSQHPADTLTGRETAEELYRLAIGLEKDAILFYQGLKAVMTGADDLALLDGLIAEEMSHVVFLTECIDKLAAP